MFDDKPIIGDFTKEECAMIYSGEYESILESFLQMPGKERDAKIIKLLGEIGHTEREVLEMLNLAVDEWEDQKRVKQYAVSAQRINNFYQDLLEMYQQEDLPEDQRDLA